MVSVVTLNCPVCGAPASPETDRCPYCRSILVLKTDHPRINPQTLNRAVVDERIAVYRARVQEQPNDVEAHFGLGVAYFNLGLTEAAIDSLERACRITPENPHIHTQLAVAYREDAQRGDQHAMDEHREHVRYALRLDHDNVQALLLAALLPRTDVPEELSLNYAERAWHLDRVTAANTYGELLRTWAVEKQRQGTMTATEWTRIEEFSPALMRELRGNTRSTVSGLPSHALNAPAALTGRPQWLNAVLGAVAGFVAMIIGFCIGTSVQPDNDPSAWYGFAYLIFMTFPLVFAIIGWKRAKRNQ